MTMPGFTAEWSLGGHHAFAGAAHRRPAPDGVVPAIPPCHACGDILELCARGEARGAVCRYCAVGFCDPQDWRNPPRPFPRSEPWNVPF